MLRVSVRLSVDRGGSNTILCSSSANTSKLTLVNELNRLMLELLYSAISPRLAMSKDVNGFELDDVWPADDDARRILCTRGYKARGLRIGA